MHDVVIIFHLFYVLTAAGTLFGNMSNLQFHGHLSYFRKDFQMMLTLKEGHT